MLHSTRRFACPQRELGRFGPIANIRWPEPLAGARQAAPEAGVYRPRPVASARIRPSAPAVTADRGPQGSPAAGWRIPGPVVGRVPAGLARRRREYPRSGGGRVPAGLAGRRNAARRRLAGGARRLNRRAGAAGSPGRSPAQQPWFPLRSGCARSGASSSPTRSTSSATGRARWRSPSPSSPRRGARRRSRRCGSRTGPALAARAVGGREARGAPARGGPERPLPVPGGALRRTRRGPAARRRGDRAVPGRRRPTGARGPRARPHTLCAIAAERGLLRDTTRSSTSSSPPTACSLRSPAA